MNPKDQTEKIEGSKNMLEEERDHLVSHMTLKGPLEIQVLLLTRIRERGATITTHVMNLRRQGLLPLMVR